MALKKNNKNKTYNSIKKDKDELHTAFACQALWSDTIYTLDDYPDMWALFMKFHSWPARTTQLMRINCLSYLCDSSPSHLQSNCRNRYLDDSYD